MSIETLYNKTVTYKRLADVTGTKKEAWQLVGTGSGEGFVATTVLCNIQPIEGSQSEMLEGGFFSTFKMFCDEAVGIKVGDRVIDGSDTYTVKGIKTFDFAGNASVKHKNLLLVKNV